MAQGHKFKRIYGLVRSFEFVDECELCHHREAGDGSHRIAVNENNIPYSETESAQRLLTPCAGS